MGADGRLTLDGSLVPRVLFTEPAYARVGRDEQEARAEGIAYAVARYDFADVGMAVVMEETQGFLKLLARRADGRLLGAQILGTQAETLIHEAVLALALGATAEEAGAVCPTTIPPCLRSSPWPRNSWRSR